MPHRRFQLSCLGALIAVTLLASPALALDPAPAQIICDVRLVEPSRELVAQLGVEGLFIPSGDTKSAGDYNLFLLDSKAWVGLPKLDGLPQMVVGHDLTFLRVNLTDQVLPRQLINESVYLGAELGQWQGWKFSASGGIGYAGDMHYGDGSGYFGRGGIIGVHQVTENSYLALGVTYAGDRTLLPDVPLPVVAWRSIGERLTWQIGFPESSLRWRLDDRFTLSADYQPPLTLHTTLDCALNKEWGLFAAYHNRMDGFTVEGTPGNTRLFFQQQRFEAGVRCTTFRGCTLVLAGGYAFDQSFSTGFDARDLTTALRLSNEPYIRATLVIGIK